MKREDFKKGQTVWLLLTGWRVRKGDTIEDRIKEYKVVSVGTKYITVIPKGVDDKGAEVKFEVEKKFRQLTTGDPNYILFLSKDDIFKKDKRSDMERIIRKTIILDYGVTLSKMSDEDLEQIVKICEKYLHQ